MDSRTRDNMDQCLEQMLCHHYTHIHTHTRRAVLDSHFLCLSLSLSCSRSFTIWDISSFQRFVYRTKHHFNIHKQNQNSDNSVDCVIDFSYFISFNKHHTNVIHIIMLNIILGLCSIQSLWTAYILYLHIRNGNMICALTMYLAIVCSHFICIHIHIHTNHKLSSDTTTTTIITTTPYT